NAITAQQNPAAPPSAVVAAISANLGVGTIASAGFAGSAEGLMTFNNGKWFGYLAGGIYIGFSISPLLALPKLLLSPLAVFTWSVSTTISWVWNVNAGPDYLGWFI